MEGSPQRLKLSWLLKAMDGRGQQLTMPSVDELVEQIKAILPNTAGDLDLIELSRKFGADIYTPRSEGDYGIENIHYALMQYVVEDVAPEFMPTIVQLSNWVLHFQTYDDEMYPPVPFSYLTYVKGSTIEGAGYGLFALNILEVGDDVADYGGNFYPTEADYQEELTKNSGRYVVGPLKKLDDTGIGAGFVVDGETGFFLSQQGRFANTKRTQEECNCEYRVHPDEGATEPHEFRLVLVATKHVAPDEELFVWYSQEYSDHIYGKDAVE